jgi:hypothetical protein
VDNGEWMAAELRTPISGQTWVIWRFDWPRQRGKHTFTVRCFEEDGTSQIAQEAPPDRVAPPASTRAPSCSEQSPWMIVERHSPAPRRAILSRSAALDRLTSSRALWRL